MAYYWLMLYRLQLCVKLIKYVRNNSKSEGEWIRDVNIEGTVILTERQAMYVWRNSEVSWCNYCNSGKAISRIITHSECVSVACSVSRARGTLCCHLWSVRLHNIFSLYLINNRIFGGEKKLLNAKCVLIFCTIFVWNISHSKKNSARYQSNINVGLHVKCRPILLSDFNETWIFWTEFRKLLKYQISWNHT